MHRFCSFCLWWFAALSVALAQPQPPHIGYVYPAGGRQGTTFDIAVGGQYLSAASNVYFSGVGVQGVVIEHAPPLTSKEVGAMREKLQELRKFEKLPATAREIAAIRKKLDLLERARQNPAIAETIPVRVMIAPDAAPGDYELRVGAPAGLSNPRVFQVGQLTEFRKPEFVVPDEAMPRAVTGKNRKPNAPPEVQSATPHMAVSLPATLNGQIAPGGVDRYRFAAQAGDQLILVVSARQLIPYLADAVPGWFQATVTLFDSQGQELTYDDHYRFRPDPVLAYKIPRNGEYMFEIRDTLYRGREDFVYRVTVGKLPFVTGIFPLGGQVGERSVVGLEGWNLPFQQLTMDFKDKEPGTYPFPGPSARGCFNQIPFSVDTLPECLEREPNGTITNAQLVTLPVIVNGRINQPGDVDVFRFEGLAGDRIVADVCARRLDSPLDSVLQLTDADGREVARNDDHVDKALGLNTHYADSYLNVTLPTSGVYYVHLRDAQQKGGWAFGYRLRLSAPRPDFSLRVVPSSLNIRGGASVPLTAYTLRKDGFAGEISFSLKNAPDGFKLTATRVATNQDQVKLTLNASPTVAAEPFRLHIEGRAMIQSQEVVRAAVPAEDMMQAFAYRHLVAAKDLKIAIVKRPGAKASAKALGDQPVKAPAGGAARHPVEMPATKSLGSMQSGWGGSIRTTDWAATGGERTGDPSRPKIVPSLRDG